MKRKLFIFVFFSLFFRFQSFSQQIIERPGFDFGSDVDGKTTRILFIFDCSFSMYSTWVNTESRMGVAKRILSGFMDSIKNVPNLEIAFRCYGHQTAFQQHDCKDSRLEVPFDIPSNNVSKIKSVISRIKPTGTTPIAYTLEKCADDFTPCTNCKNIIILITDGVEECDGDPCAVSSSLQKNNIFLRPFIIGISDFAGFVNAFSCMGKFYDVNNPANFSTVLRNIMTQAITQTTVQVNLNDINKNPVETDVPMSFYSNADEVLKYNYVHTLNHRGLPDTIILNPDIIYNLVVHTIPPVEKRNIKITKGKHNTVVLDAPQGLLNVSVDGSFKNIPIDIVVRKPSEAKTLNVQQSGSMVRYLVGKYDLEILTLPRIKLNNVEISQSSTKSIKIPGSGMVSVTKRTKGIGSIYVEETGKFNWVYNLNNELQGEIFYLQPGNYRIEYRLETEKDSEKTIEKKFTVKSGQTLTLNF
ncbi:MAG: vWA domain-containing protein [Bacteroidota bacterium]|jgi:Ca-activated chloride channel family protein